MNIDIAKHIERLLFLHDTLVIPGLGGFTATRASASVDYATNTIHPPSKTLTFSENLATDDGLLVEDLAHTYGLSLEEARRILDEFVQQTQAKLDQRDIVNLPGVGRLYKNYLQKIQFLPDATNFNAGAYGLPPLQFSPIARSRETAVAEPASVTAASAAAPTETATPLVPPMPPLPNPPVFDSTTPPPPRASASRFGLGIGIGLILCTAVFGLWWWQYRKDRPTPTLQQQLTEMEQAKPISPLPDIAGLGQAAENAQKQQQPKASPALPEIEEPDLDDEVSANAEERRQALERLQKEDQRPPKNQPASPRSRQCVLIVATLSNPENADRLAAQLQNAGYNVYDQPKGRARQVGISFSYTDPREIEQRKAELQQLTGEKNIYVKAK
ncbi:MAG: hypothetical protein RMJ33_10235 [Saprospiraceae bacterium]|nr:hypothetical protein [Saprospiraceae bacterium]MDW8230204.1 hypothetical protein [Saprospiraceae bacterium]